MADKKNNQTLLYVIAAIVIIIIIVAGVYLVVFNKGSGSATSPTTGDVAIKASINKDCTITPWVVGEQKGYFNSSGSAFIDVGATTDTKAALVSGQINVLDSDPQGLIDLLIAGAPVTAVAQSGDDPGDGNMDKEHMQWLVLQNSSLNSIKDIPAFVNSTGRKVKIGITALGICADLQNNALFRNNNISKDDFEYVVIPDPDQEQALKQGLIDIAILHPPFYFAAEQHGGYKIFAYSSEALNGAGGTTLLVFQNSFIKDHPDAVRNFIKAYKSAEIWSDNNRAEAASLTAAAIGLDKADVHWYTRSGAINDTQLQIWIDNLVADGVIKPGQYKPTDLYTTEFSDVWNTTA
jgi:ABC-type nitrate/sulfonate/bicarbonate transport system substrate-binding protein